MVVSTDHAVLLAGLSTNTRRLANHCVVHFFTRLIHLDFPAVRESLHYYLDPLPVMRADLSVVLVLQRVDNFRFRADLIV